jgi:tetratricopeptide (TPR) repeat protein
MTSDKDAGNLDQLDMVIAQYRSVVEALPPYHPYLPGTLSNLGNALRRRFEQTGNLENLDEAIRYGEAAVEAIPEHHPDRAKGQLNLGLSYRVRFQETRCKADLDAAFENVTAAVRAMPSDSLGRAVFLSNLGQVYRVRYEQTGSLADLDAAIRHGRAAVDAAPSDGPESAPPRSNLGMAYIARFEQTEDELDLNAAIDLFEKAVGAMPDDHPGRAVPLSNLGQAYIARFGQARNGADLDAAIRHGSAILDIAPSGHPGRAVYLSSLGEAYRLRYELSRKENDLDAAIHYCEASVDAAFSDRPSRVAQLFNLARAYLMRSQQTRGERDLDTAVDMFRNAVAATPSDQPDRARCLSYLAAALQARFERTGQPSDLDATIRFLREAMAVVTAPPRDRLGAASALGWAAFQAGHYDAGVEGYTAAVDLLPLVAWHGLRQEAREEHLAQWMGTAADAAACAIAARRASLAVELLEAGRSLLWSQALSQRSDLSRLAKRAPGLAAALEEARAELKLHFPSFVHAGPFYGYPIPTGDQGPMRTIQLDALERRRKAARRWDDALAQARRLEGFEHFLAPMPFAELRQSAAKGPVVIVNASRLGCHALVVTADGDTGAQVVDLPDLTYGEAVDRAQMLLGIQERARDTARTFPEQERDRHAVFQMLEWLWDTITRPVLDALRHTCPLAEQGKELPRVWWCPTGPLTFLPLHAAGRYPRNRIQQKRQRGTAVEAVAEHMVSSYIPTLAALLRARRPGNRAPARQLAVGVPEAAGFPPLPAVADELDVLAKYFPTHAIRLFPRRSYSTQLVGSDATQSAVLAALPRHSWLHLACHGVQHLAYPSRSFFALHDAALSIVDLADLPLQKADLAYLSACQTATGDVRLPDEAMHLAAAMQLIGYRHVIAALWTIADNPSPGLADAVYAHLTAARHPNADLAAHALHQAVATLRSNLPDEPLLWAPYIHVGP